MTQISTLFGQYPVLWLVVVAGAIWLLFPDLAGRLRRDAKPTTDAKKLLMGGIDIGVEKAAEHIQGAIGEGVAGVIADFAIKALQRSSQVPTSAPSPTPAAPSTAASK